MIKTICLIGNPNCGKTSLFNALTGQSEKVGNWAGVTTAQKEGLLLKDKSIKVIDLPGIYSLSAQSKDEKVVLDYLKENKPSVIINVLDGTNLERNLSLTSEIIKLNIPTILAINFCDDLIKNGIKINHGKLQTIFGVKTIEISAKKQINIDELITAVYVAKKPDFGCKILKCDNLVNCRKLISDNRSIILLNDNITKGQNLTEELDKIFLHKFWAIPIFALIICFVYAISSLVGGKISSYISVVLDNFATLTSKSMLSVGFSDWAISLFCGAIIGGVGSVLAFTPQILLLFLFMTVIEESGYATRISIIFDRIFRLFGLGGKSVIPIVLSCGCSVTGIMSTRTIENDSERKKTIFLTSFMPCGAKTIVYAWFSYAFFNGSPFVSTIMYFIGIFSIGFFGLILNKFRFFNVSEKNFLVEVPTYRFPSFRNVARALWEKFKDFTYKSGTVIFFVSVVLWLLSNFGIKGYATNITDSFLYSFGNIVKYIFYPLGFGNWQASVSIITGLFAKEAIIETMQQLAPNFNQLFENNFSIFAFMIFVLISPPCMASLTTAKNELGSKKEFFLMLIFQFLSAYLMAFFVVALGKIFSLINGLIFFVMIVIILTTIMVFRAFCLNKKSKRQSKLEKVKNV